MGSRQAADAARHDPAGPGETLDASHIQSYWQQHVPLVKAGIDAFWPDEGDWFNLFERIKRHQLYYQGHLSTHAERAAVEPAAQRLSRASRSGAAGSGRATPRASWKTLEAQIAVGLNYSLSIGPYWGSDIGGFYPNNELTGELYARWYQFAAFCGSFRSHGRTWWTRLPWGWGLSDMGPRENNNTNAPIPPDDRRNILQSEMNNPAIEPVAKKYAELRYQLMPYTYTLAWEARETRPAADARDVAALSRRRARARPRHSVSCGAATCSIAPVFTKGATSRDVYLPTGDWYDWWTNAKSRRRPDASRAQVDLATMPIYVRAGAIIPVDPVRQYTSAAGHRADDAQGLSRRRRPVHAVRGRRHQPGLPDGRGHLDADDVERSRAAAHARARRARAARRTSPRARTFKVQLLPEGTTKDITYSGVACR